MPIDAPTTNNSHKTLCVVGIGASAGGLDALTKLLAQLKPDNKKVFVIAQHMGKDNYLTPLLGLLRRISTLPIIEASHNIPLVPDQIFIIPAGVNGEIQQGRIQLASPSDTHISSPSVNILFASIARYSTHNAIGVILSGAGSDGRMGAQQIKDHGGRVIVQQPASAQFDGMPSAAIEARLANHILPPEELALLLNEWSHMQPHAKTSDHPASMQPTGAPTTADQSAALSQLLQKVRIQTGRDFSGYKEETLFRRVHRRMSFLHISRLTDYLNYTESYPHELSILQQQFLISVSSFFRDHESFAVLKKHLSELISRKQPGDSIRIWVPGCATGEECYSLAILLVEILAERISDFDINIIGSDLNEDAIATARTGMYNQTTLREAAPEIILRHIDQQESGYSVKPHIHALCRFQIEDVLQHQPADFMDMVSCRNLLIYLKSQLQDKLLKTFYEVLTPQGLMFIGQSETIGVLGSSLFMPLDHFHRIYSCKKNHFL